MNLCNKNTNNKTELVILNCQWLNDVCNGQDKVCALT